jgi:hypothetical protein
MILKAFNYNQSGSVDFKFPIILNMLCNSISKSLYDHEKLRMFSEKRFSPINRGMQTQLQAIIVYIYGNILAICCNIIRIQ